MLLLTGTLHNTKHRVSGYLAGFQQYEWLWLDDADAIFQQFISSKPEVDDYEQELIRFQHIEEEIEAIESSTTIGPLLLDNTTIKEQLKELTHQWRFRCVPACLCACVPVCLSHGVCLCVRYCVLLTLTVTTFVFYSSPGTPTSCTKWRSPKWRPCTIT